MMKQLVYHRPALLSSFCLIAMLAVAPSSLSAQGIWEYSPYKVRVWIANDGSPELGGSFARSLDHSIEWTAEQIDASGWAVDARQVEDIEPYRIEGDQSELEPLDPSMLSSWKYEINQQIGEVVLPEDAAQKKIWIQGDKLFLTSIRRPRLGEYTVQVRELDCQTLIWGPVFVRTCFCTKEIPAAVSELLTEAFSPVTRVVEVEGKVAKLRVKAVGLSVKPNSKGKFVPNLKSPVWIKPNDVLMPLIRRVNRLGTIEDGGIKIIDWTFLTTQENQPRFQGL